MEWTQFVGCCHYASGMEWYLLPFFDSNETLLDHQIMTPVFVRVIQCFLCTESVKNA